MCHYVWKCDPIGPLKTPSTNVTFTLPGKCTVGETKRRGATYLDCIRCYQSTSSSTATSGSPHCSTCSLCTPRPTPPPHLPTTPLRNQSSPTVATDDATTHLRRAGTKRHLYGVLKQHRRCRRRRSRGPSPRKAGTWAAERRRRRVHSPPLLLVLFHPLRRPPGGPVSIHTSCSPLHYYSPELPTFSTRRSPVYDSCSPAAGHQSAAAGRPQPAPAPGVASDV